MNTNESNPSKYLQQALHSFCEEAVDGEYGTLVSEEVALEAIRAALTADTQTGGEVKAAEQKKAQDAFVSVANGLADALDKEEWDTVYGVWRNIADGLTGAKPELGPRINATHYKMPSVVAPADEDPEHPLSYWRGHALNLFDQVRALEAAWRPVSQLPYHGQQVSVYGIAPDGQKEVTQATYYKERGSGEDVFNTGYAVFTPLMWQPLPTPPQPDTAASPAPQMEGGEPT